MKTIHSPITFRKTYLRTKLACKKQIALNLVARVDRLALLQYTAVQIHDALGDGAIDQLVAVVDENEKQIEATQNRRRQLYVLPKRARLVVPTANRIGRSQNRGARVERRLDAGLGDRYRLLLHRLVNGHLIAYVHLVELVNAANALLRRK